ncbi:MAG: hypothetical protein R2847_07135 [Bacteroidia bacterium]
MAVPLLPAQVAEIEAIIKDRSTIDVNNLSLEDFKASGMLSIVDLETMYIDHVKANFDLQAIKNCGRKWAYDAMYGAGQNVMKKLFPEITMLHCEHNPALWVRHPNRLIRIYRSFQS